MGNETMGTFGMVFAFAVQWLRARKAIPELATVLLSCAVGALCYWLGHDGANPLTKEFWGPAVIWMLAGMGVTQGASSLNRMGVAPIPGTNTQP